MQYQLYLSEYITERVAATSICHTVLSHIEGSRRACFPAKTETISAFGFPPGKHPFIVYNEYVRQHPELFDMSSPSKRYQLIHISWSTKRRESIRRFWFTKFLRVVRDSRTGPRHSRQASLHRKSPRWCSHS